MIKVDEYGHKITVNAIKIPPNATNGDMIKTVFSNAKITYFTNIYDNQLVRVDLGHHTVDFNEWWWNAPYKGGDN